MMDNYSGLGDNTTVLSCIDVNNYMNTYYYVKLDSGSVISRLPLIVNLWNSPYKVNKGL